MWYIGRVWWWQIYNVYLTFEHPLYILPGWIQDKIFFLNSDLIFIKQISMFTISYQGINAFRALGLSSFSLSRYVRIFWATSWEIPERDRRGCRGSCWVRRWAIWFIHNSAKGLTSYVKVEGTGADCLSGITGSGFANLSRAFSAENTQCLVTSF